MIETQLERLSLGKDDLELDADMMKTLRTTFGDLLSTSPSTLTGAFGAEDMELKYWDCFAEVYLKEVEHQQSLNDTELTKEQRQQILADVLVWAEITQQHYDASTAKFVIEPNKSDDQFQRIGEVFRRAKRRRDLH